MSIFLYVYHKRSWPCICARFMGKCVHGLRSNLFPLVYTCVRRLWATLNCHKAFCKPNRGRSTQCFFQFCIAQKQYTISYRNSQCFLSILIVTFIQNFPFIRTFKIVTIHPPILFPPPSQGTSANWAVSHSNAKNSSSI